MGKAKKRTPPDQAKQIEDQTMTCQVFETDKLVLQRQILLVDFGVRAHRRTALTKDNLRT